MPLSCRSRAIFAVSTLVCCTALLNCRDNVPRGSPADEGASTAPIVPAALALALRASNGRWEARAQGDSVVRMLVTSRRDDRSTSRLCGHLVTRSVAASAIPFGLPIDTTMPPLAIRLIDGDSVSGLRYLVPGKQGYYVFEGLSRDGSRRISVRWPISSDSTRPIPAGAADSLIEAAVTPNPYMLDSALQAMRPGASAINRELGDLPPADSARAMAMPLVRDFPDQTFRLSDACPQATILLPVLARIDQKLRVPVHTGDRVSARALSEEGSVQLSFDEASPVAKSPAEPQTSSAVAFTSPSDGRVTLRVRLQVPRVQHVQPRPQNIVISVGRISTRHSGGP